MKPGQQKHKGLLTHYTSDGSHSVKATQLEFWISHYSGVVLCLAIGVVLAVSMPVCGLIFCCCRCCRKHDDVYRHKRRTLCNKWFPSISAISSTIFISAGLTYAFMANFWVDKIVYDTPLNKQMNERGLPQVVKSSIALVRDYLKETIESLPELFKEVHDNLSSSISELSWSAYATEELKNFALYKEILKIDNEVTEITSGLEIIFKKLQRVANLGKVLEIMLSRDYYFSKEENEEFISCLDPLKSFLFPNFTNQNFQIKHYMETVEETINELIKENLALNYTKIFSGLDIDISSPQNQVNSSREVIENLLISLKEYIENIDGMYTFEFYRFYGFIVILSCIFLVILLNIFGVTCGLLANFKVQWGRRRGSTTLFLDLMLIFVFFPIMMLVLMLTFATGSVAYIDICRGFQYRSNNSAVQIINLLGKNVTNSTDFSILETLDDCRQNKGIIEAIKKKSFVEDKLNYKDGISKYVDRLEFGSINCIPELPDLSQVMNELSAIRISSISVNTYIDKLENVIQ